MKESIRSRLQQIMDERKLKQIDIIELCQPYCEKYNIKIGKSDMSQYMSGKANPKQNKLTILAMALGVQETWLLGYDVPMRAPAATIKDNPEQVTKAIELYERYLNLPPEKQTEFQNFLKFLQSGS